MKAKLKRNKFLVISLVMCLFSAVFSSLILHNFGKVRVENVSIGTSLGSQTGYLFIPEEASWDNKLPVIVVSHGSTSNNNTIESWCMELSRRGYVVYAPNMYNHGTSAVPDERYAGTKHYESNGLIDAVEYVYGLDFIDQERIGVVGHSLGGNSTLITGQYYTQLETDALANGATAEEAHKLNKVNAIMSVGYPLQVTIVGFESTATFDGLSTNLGVILGKYDEFQSWMNKDILTNQYGVDWLKTQTGIVADEVEEGKYYVNPETGYGFAMWNPGEIHSQAYVSTDSTAYIIDFFEETLGAPNKIDSYEQIWFVKKVISVVGIVGFFMFIISLATTILKTRSFSDLQGSAVELEPLTKDGKKRFIRNTIVNAVISTIVMLPMIIVGTYMLPKAIWPQLGTNGFAMWGCVGGLISFALLRKRKGKKLKECKEELGFAITTPGGKGKSLYTAFLVIGIGYLMIFIIKWFFNVDFRFWNFAIMPFEASKLTILLRYLPLFFVFQLSNAVSAWQTNWRGWSDGKRVLLSTTICMLPIIAMLLISYLPILFIGSPLWAMDGSNLFLLALGDSAIKVISFIVNMAVVSVVNIKMQKLTGSVWLGAFMNMFFIAMNSVANCSQFMPW